MHLSEQGSHTASGVAFFTRKKACELLGGLIAPTTLANLDRGRNKLRKQVIGKKVVYAKSDFIPWLERVMDKVPRQPPTRKRQNDTSKIDLTDSAKIEHEKS